MREHEAFLKQARGDYQVFKHLLAEDRERIPSCHPLHYLQMSAEKLAKAIKLAAGDQAFDRYSHVAFSHLPTLLGRRDLAGKIGIGNFRKFQSFLRRAKEGVQIRELMEILLDRFEGIF